MATEDYEEPFGWWGWHWQPPQPLSVVQILEAGSFDAEMLGLLWALMSRRASVIVGAEPPLAGKTTTLTALIDFLPPETRRIYMRGHYENFDFVNQPQVEPRRSYLLANEMSDHLAIYFWGARVGRLFSLLPEGYAFGSTMHAETVDEVLDILSSPPLNVPPRLLGGLSLVINLVLLPGAGRATRRCADINLVMPSESASGVETVRLARWDRKNDRFEHFHEEAQTAAALSRWAGAGMADLTAEIRGRAEYLDKLLQNRVRSIPTVREALCRYSLETRRETI